MGVEGDGEADVLAELGDHVVGDAGGDDAGHVFDADRVAAEVAEFGAHFDKGFDGVDGAGGVADFAAGVFAAGFDRLDGGGEVAGIIEGVEDAEDVLAGGGVGANEGFDDVVGEGGVLDDVLPAQEHELGGLGRGFFEGAEAVEGVFAEEAEAGVDGGAAPGLEAGEAHLVEDGGGGEHLRGGHARGGEGLVAVAQDGVVKKDGLHGGKRMGETVGSRIRPRGGGELGEGRGCGCRKGCGGGGHRGDRRRGSRRR